MTNGDARAAGGSASLLFREINNETKWRAEKQKDRNNIPGVPLQRVDEELVKVDAGGICVVLAGIWPADSQEEEK